MEHRNAIPRVLKNQTSSPELYIDSYHECVSYVAVQAITNEGLNMILANQEAQTRAYQYYVTVCSSVPSI